MNEPSNTIKRASILVVDDAPKNLYVLSEMLRVKKYEVRPVLSAALALAAIKNNPPDLILLDILMPKMNGYEVCEILKADEKTKGDPRHFYKRA